MKRITQSRECWLVCLHVRLDATVEEVSHKATCAVREHPQEWVQEIHVTWSKLKERLARNPMVLKFEILRGTVNSIIPFRCAETIAAATSEGFNNLKKFSKRILTFLHRPVSTMYGKTVVNFIWKWMKGLKSSNEHSILKADLRWTIRVVPQLFVQRFHAASYGELRSTIRHKIIQSNQPCDARQGHNVAAIVFDHLWQESMEHPVVGECVDLEDHSNLFLGMFENLVLRHDARIVHENGDVSDIWDYQVAGRQDFFSICHIDAEIVQLARWSFLNLHQNRVNDTYV